MEIGSTKVDMAKIEQGEWVSDIPDMGDLRLKVRGVNNSDWRLLASQLVAAVPRGKKVSGRVHPDEQDRITSELVLRVGLLDWENVTQGGQPVPYSKEQARTFLTDPAYRAFRDAALWACTVVGDAAHESVETDAKN
jgi:hypothetical protein